MLFFLFLIQLDNFSFTVKDAYDYQGRSFLHVPQDVGVNLKSDEPPEKCFIPKKELHTWSAHSKAISTIKWFPRSAHLLLSCGMDCRIKVSIYFKISHGLILWNFFNFYWWFQASHIPYFTTENRKKMLLIKKDTTNYNFSTENFYWHFCRKFSIKLFLLIAFQN